MDDRGKEEEEKIGKCKKCGAKIKSKYIYCSICEKTNKVIVIYERYDDLKRTVDFYRLLCIDKFQELNEIVLSFTEQRIHIADMVIRGIRHMGLLQGKRKMETVKTHNPPYNKVQYLKAPLSLIPALKDMKFDKGRKFYD